MPIITQETANLVDTLATAAAKIGSTKASAKLNELIVAILPDTVNQEGFVEALRADNADLEGRLETLVTAMKDVQAKLEEILAIDHSPTIREATESLKSEVDGFLLEIGE